MTLPISITGKFNNEYNSFCDGAQHYAAMGLFGVHAYKKILDTNNLAWIALTILNLATVCATATTISPIYTIILSGSFVALLAFTTKKIYERYSFQTNGRILEPIFNKVLEGNFVSAFEQLNDRLSSIISIEDTEKRKLKFNLFAENAPFIDSRCGLNYINMHVFYWYVSTLNALEKTQDGNLETFKRYRDEIFNLNCWISVRCSDRSTKLLDISKGILERIPAPRAEMDDILWNDLNEKLTYNPRKHGSYEEFKTHHCFRGCLPDLLNFVKNLSQAFPQNPNSKRYQNCCTLEQFYQASNVEI